jgi:hypothetical protein
MRGIVLGVLMAVVGVGCQTKAPSQAEMSEIVQAVLDHPALQPYFHPEKKGRVPVVVSDLMIGTQVQATKFGKPIRLENDPSLGSHRPFWRFTSVKVRDDQAEVSFEYPVEDLSGTINLRKDADGRWQAGNHRLNK